MELWEGIQTDFNARIKSKGVKNAYFPMFIPESFFHKEAMHAEGFSPEVAWIANKEEGEERLALRPTSETIMYDAYSRWIRSWRDLPLRINQWCNIVRWETEATKLFLRSREFLWQEGHCVYETEEECDREVEMFLREYRDMCEHLLAMPLIMGRKTEREKFAGAKYTLTIEAFMPDGKALQCGTSHNLGQGFAKAFEIGYLGKDGERHLPWQSSWGVSTRLIGGMIMTHSDDKGLVLPPAVAPNKIVIVPIIFDETRDAVLGKCNEIRESLSKYGVILDDRDEYKPGWKFNEWELKGVPLRIELGPKDLDAGQCVVVRRDTGQKEFVKIQDVKAVVAEMLDAMQKDLYNRAKEYMDASIVEVNDYSVFKQAVGDRKLIRSAFCGQPDCEGNIKDETGATTRCVPLEGGEASEGAKCVHCGKDATCTIYFSKSY